jgi:hypothetical protein
MKCSVYRSSIRRCAVVAMMLVMALVFMAEINGPLVGSAAGESNIDMMSVAYKRETWNMIMDLDAPLPVERIENTWKAWKIKTFGPYEDRLKELGAWDSRVEFSAKELYVRDHSTVIQKYITEDKIIDYAKGGEADDVFCDPDGNPLVRKLNMNEKASKAFDNAIKLIQEAGINNIYESIRASGMCVCAIDICSPGIASLIDKDGAVYANMGDRELNLPDKNLTYLFIKLLMDEPTGVLCGQKLLALGIDSFIGGGAKLVELMEILKCDMGADLCAFLEEKPFATLVGTYSAQGESYAKKFGISVDDPRIERYEDLFYETEVILGENLVGK